MVEEKLLFIKKKYLYLKINKIPEDLDEVEKKFMELLKKIKEEADEKYIKNDYINLDRAMKSPSVQSKIRKAYKEIDSKIRKESKSYINKKGQIIFQTILIIALFASWFLAVLLFFWFYLACIILFNFITRKSALLIRYKEDFYKEYEHWQSFKHYLSHSYTIRSATHETIVMWEEYLLYATALGIPEKVLKEGERIKLVDEQHFAIYTGVYHSSTSVSASYGAATGHGGGGGGFGGAGGGGVGGGGGGGR